MLMDSYKRKIDYLRISVTDRCNLRCVYCMPEYGILSKAPDEILSFEEIIRITKLAISMGINKIRITGGEPLVRKDLPELLQLLSSLSGLRDLSLTTNGILLPKYIKDLKNAGLKKLNVSIDTLDKQKFKYLARGGNLEDVLSGIDAAIKEGFFIKLNVVVMKGLNDGEILDFARFVQEKRLIVRFIELMPMDKNNIFSQDFYISAEEIKDKLKALGKLKAISVKFGNGPARYYKIENSSIIIGFISPISCQFCFYCNRLRLTADGILMPCLNSQVQFDLKKSLGEGAEQEVLDLIKEAIILKPPGHNFIQPGWAEAKAEFAFVAPKAYLMSQIGG